jgi:serine/threonine protein kinase
MDGDPTLPSRCATLSRRLLPLESHDPKRIGAYRLVARLGAGGMGTVYLGRSSDDQPVAVKLIRPELADDPGFRERFRREAIAAARIDGVCTARVHGAELEGSRPYLVTEFIDGPTLQDFIQMHGPMTDPTLLRALAIGLLEALVAVHAANVVHRDFKPANVILASDGPKVVDFGIAHALEFSAITHAGTIIGSPAWMAPEQLQTSAVTAAADIFAWASTVFFAATGTAPYGLGRPEVILYRVVHAAPDLQSVPEFLRDPMAAAFSKDPQKRPEAPALLSTLIPPGTGAHTSPSSIATEVLADTWRVEEGQAPAPVGKLAALPRHRRRPAMWASISVAIILVFIGLVAWGFRNRPTNTGALSSPSSVPPALEPTTTGVSEASTTPTTASAMTTTVAPVRVDPTTAFRRLAAQYPESTQSPIVPRPDGDLAAIGYGQGVAIFRYTGGDWITRGTVTLSELVDTGVAIDVADVTFDGEPDFLIHLRTGSTKGGSVVSAHSRSWRLVPFLNDSGVAEPWRTGATISSGRLLTYAVGSRVAEPWLYSAEGGYLYRNLGPGRGGIGE